MSTEAGVEPATFGSVNQHSAIELFGPHCYICPPVPFGLNSDHDVMMMTALGDSIAAPPPLIPTPVNRRRLVDKVLHHPLPSLPGDDYDGVI